MKRSWLFAFFLGVAACNGNPENPAAPSSASTGTAVDSSAVAGSGVFVPFHILHPVLFPMQQGIVVFPPRNEPNAFFQDLQALYRDVLGRPQTATTFVDSEGQNVWLTEYFRFYLNGCSHEDATSRTLQEITTGGTLPTCGSENLVFPSRDLPNAFQNRLQATYADVLRRPQTVSYLDSEGANVWLAQYLRFRVAGNCDHATAQSKVFTEIRGGGVQPICEAPGGPRTSDPAPGTRIPLPNIQAFVEQASAARPELIGQSCPGGIKYQNNPWLDYIVDRLRTLDTRWGYNKKPTRTPADNGGNPVIAAGDEVAYHFGAGADEGSPDVYLIDLLEGHCGANPRVTYRVFTGEEPGIWTGVKRF